MYYYKAYCLSVSSAWGGMDEYCMNSCHFQELDSRFVVLAQGLLLSNRSVNNEIITN
ncbi:hypothetical protein [uncultured Bacteroides sp.]|uniref:hypothetical protein n=1 Tax=uncultured Bacteroides sp. TaxID=162156 RepID=UPI002AA7D5D0|nr:hypothetical protein [uncultured Bacteroides sp.]